MTSCICPTTPEVAQQGMGVARASKAGRCRDSRRLIRCAVLPGGPLASRQQRLSRREAPAPLMAAKSVEIELIGEEGEELSATMEITQGNQLLSFSMPKPLGMLLEESQDSRILVVEVVDGGNAQACGVREGDILQAVTARSLEAVDAGFMRGMRKRTKESLFGSQVLLKTAGEEFDTVMSAIASNRCSQCTIQVVVERPVSGNAHAD